MFTFCLFMFSLQPVVLSKTRKLQYTNRVNLSVFTVHLAKNIIDTSFQSFTLFIKSTLADIMIFLFLKLGITMLIHTKTTSTSSLNSHFFGTPCSISLILNPDKLDYKPCLSLNHDIDVPV